MPPIPANFWSITLSSRVAANAAVASLLCRRLRNTHHAVVPKMARSNMTLSNHGHHVFPLSLSSCKQTPKSRTTGHASYPHAPPLRMDPSAHDRHCPSLGPVHDVQFAKQGAHDETLTCQKVEAGQAAPHRPDDGVSTGKAGEHVRHCPVAEHVAQSAGQGKHRLSEVDWYVPSGQVVTHVPVGVAYLFESVQRVHWVAEEMHSEHWLRSQAM